LLEIRGDDPGPLFILILKGERFEYRPMSTQAIYKMLKKRGDQAGVKNTFHRMT